MQTLIAAVVLAWIVLVVMAFALAGLLRQLRDVQATLRGHHTALSPSRQVPEHVRPRAGAAHAIVLLVSPDCAVCDGVVPEFAAFAATAPDGLDFVLLTASAKPEWDELAAVRTVVDSTAFHILDPGWRPALVLLGATGDVVLAEPAGSEAALRTVVESIAGERLTAR